MNHLLQEELRVYRIQINRWRGETPTSRGPMLFPAQLVDEIEEEESTDQQPLGTLQKGSIDIQGCRTGTSHLSSHI